MVQLNSMLGAIVLAAKGAAIPEPGTGGLMAMLTTFIVIFLLVGVFICVVNWKIYTKAGQPGWASLVPIYNWIIFCRIAGQSEFYWLLWCIPCIGVIFAIISLVKFCESFGKDVGFAIGMILLPIIFYPILAFGSAEYIGPGGKNRRRSTSRYDDDDDDRPRGRGRARDDDDDDDDRPRRRRREREDDDDEVDDRPRRR